MDVKEKKQPLISVIVPVYNVEKYLPTCVNSIIGQTYKNIEVLLIDDGSTDASGELCDDFCIKDRRCKAIHQENQGQSGARNTGLRNATGEYISFIDGDDYIHPQFYEVLYNAISEGDYDFSMIGYTKVNEGGVNNHKEFNTPYQIRVLQHEQLMQELFYWSQYGDIAMITVCNKLYKRETIHGLEFRNFGTSEDHEYNNRVFLKISAAVIVENAELYYYVQRATSTVHKAFDHRNIDMINCFLLCLNDIPKEKPQHRGPCLARLYKTILSTRYNAPKSFKKEVSQTVQNAAKSTIKEFVRNRHIPFIAKISTLFFYYCPAAYSSYIWLMQNDALYKLYTKIAYGK